MVTTNRSCGPAARWNSIPAPLESEVFQRKSVGIGVTGAGGRSYVLGKWWVPKSIVVLCALKRGEAFPATQWPRSCSWNPPRNSDAVIENELKIRSVRFRLFSPNICDSFLSSLKIWLVERSHSLVMDSTVFFDHLVKDDRLWLCWLFLLL